MKLHALAFLTIFAVLPLIVEAQSRNNDEVATLYRSSVVLDYARIAIATFDARAEADSGKIFDYNFENCQIAAGLFESQAGVKTRFWCEKGFSGQ